MLFNFNLAIIAVLAGAGLVVAHTNSDSDARRFARLGRVVFPRQGVSCMNDNDNSCPGSEVCCSGLVRARSCIDRDLENLMLAICRVSERAAASVRVSPRTNAPEVR